MSDTHDAGHKESLSGSDSDSVGFGGALLPVLVHSAWHYNCLVSVVRSLLDSETHLILLLITSVIRI